MTGQAVILDGGLHPGDLTDQAFQALVPILKARGWSIESFRLREIEIAPCTGCFGCWIRTPGVCVIDDAARGIAEKIIASDLVVYLTPITFGGYSGELKKALDRTIPLILPFFKLYQGEVHHSPRYPRFPSIAFLGTLPRRDAGQEDLFEDLADRNALNMHPASYDVGILCEMSEPTAETIERVLEAVTVT